MLQISLIINFVVLVAALIFFTRKPAKNFMATRSDDIRKNVEESERLQQEAVAMLKNYEGKMNGLNAEVKELLDNARQAGEKEKMEILARADRMSAQIIENAKNMATRELAKQKTNLQKEVMTKVIAEALAKLKDKTSEQDHMQFTNQFIAQMEKQNGDIN